MNNTYETTAVAPILQYDVDKFSPTVIMNGSEYMDRQIEFMMRDTSMQKRTATVATHAIFAHHAVKQIALRALQSLPDDEASLQRIVDAADDKFIEIIRNIGRD